MKKVLIVDDEENIRELVEDFYKTYYGDRVTTHTAADGLDAFILCQNIKFDLIVSDLRMPFLSGIEFVSAVKTKPGLNKSTGIILLSAFIDKDVAEKLRTQKIEFLDKPVDDNDLLLVSDKYIF